MFVKLLQIRSTENGSKTNHCPNPKPLLCRQLFYWERQIGSKTWWESFAWKKVGSWGNTNQMWIFQTQNFFPPPESKQPQPVPKSQKTLSQGSKSFSRLLLYINSHSPPQPTSQAPPALWNDSEEHSFSPSRPVPELLSSQHWVGKSYGEIQSNFSTPRLTWGWKKFLGQCSELIFGSPGQKEVVCDLVAVLSSLVCLSF